ncbi:MAG: efflux RND transporter periplasmic adaptor subunit [Anaerolineales bacterium]|nr:efflux RND transporter periplasmic adaptor subunit [Anaerolineales bacterium]
MLNKKYLRYGLLVIVLLLTVTGCESQVENSPTPLPTTQLSEPEFEFDQDIRASGKVIILNQMNLSFPISGHVLELTVQEGDYVQEGDLIAKLDTNSLIAEVARAEGALTVAQARLDRVMAGPHESEVTEAEIEVTAVASRPSLFIAEATAQAADLAVAQARLDYLLAQPLPEDIAVAQAEVKQARLNVEASRARLNLANLVAPADGTVTEVFINAHEYASVGNPIVQMSDLTQLVLEVEMDDLEITSIDLGDVLLVTFEALPGVVVEGSVISIMPNDARVGERNFTVLIVLDVIPEGIRWGMTAEVVIPQEK